MLAAAIILVWMPPKGGASEDRRLRGHIAAFIMRVLGGRRRMMLDWGELTPAAPLDAIPRDYNFADDIFQRARDRGWLTKPAYIDPRGTWSYEQLADRVARFAEGLRGCGVRREERVLICLLDTIDWPSAFLGCLKAGVVAVPVNTLMTEDDYGLMLAHSRARVLVVSEALYARFAPLIASTPDLEHVIISGDNAHGHRKFEDLIGSAKADKTTAPTTRDDIAFWLYTSGS